MSWAKFGKMGEIWRSLFCGHHIEVILEIFIPVG